MEEDSILNYVKKALGIQPDFTHFDPELIMFINGTFSTLHQLGVGPEVPFEISSSDDLWEAFIQTETELNSVKTYVYLKVKLLFDSPATSHARTSLQDMAKELEWRLNVASERG